MIKEFKEFDALRQLGELTPDALGIYHVENATVVYVNFPFVRMFQLSNPLTTLHHDILIGKVVAEDQEYVAATVTRFFVKFKPAEFEFRIGNNTTECIVVCCNLYALMDNHFILVTLRDISRTKKSDEHMIEFGSKKNALLDSLSHNLSGALSMMQNLTAEAMKPNHADKPLEMVKYLELVNQNSRFCIDLINDLLVNEHEGSSRVVAKSVRFNVVEKIHYVVEELINSYTSKTFIIREDRPNRFATADDIKMLQVLVNLVSNAIKFTTDGATITIVIDEWGSDFIRIGVIDDGIGIPAALQPYVFDRKGIAGRVGLNGEKSLGIGLSINRRLVALMGGELWMESEENKGSAFYFTLPK